MQLSVIVPGRGRSIAIDRPNSGPIGLYEVSRSVRLRVALLLQYILLQLALVTSNAARL
jgi:hypothetical protein